MGQRYLVTHKQSIHIRLETPQNVIRRLKLLARNGLSPLQPSAPPSELVDLISVANISTLPKAIRRDLSNSNVILMDCASDKESGSDLSLVVEIMKFVYRYKPPARIVIVSNDWDFHKVIAFLDFVGYEVISVVREKVGCLLRAPCSVSHVCGSTRLSNISKVLVL